MGRPSSEIFGRWVHHLERYDHHFTAIENAQTHKRPEILALAKRYEAQHPGWSGDFLLDALEVIIQCRELLGFTYVASYSLPDDYQDQELYQFLQGNLEAQTDQLNSLLSEFTENSSNEVSFKASVNATRQYFNRMTEAIEKGLSTGYEVIQQPKTPVAKLAVPVSSSSSSKWDWFGFLKRDK